MTLKYGFSLKSLLFVSSADRLIDQNMDLFLQDKILRWKKSILRFSNRIAECRMTSKQSIHRLARVRSIGMTWIRMSDPKSLTDHEALNQRIHSGKRFNCLSCTIRVILDQWFWSDHPKGRHHYSLKKSTDVCIRPIKHQPNQISLHSNPALRTPHY